MNDKTSTKPQPNIPLDLDRLRALEQQASPGPWSHIVQRDLTGEGATRIMSDQQTVIGDGYGALDGARDEDLALLVEARNALPALLDMLEAQKLALEAIARDYPKAYHESIQLLREAAGMAR